MGIKFPCAQCGHRLNIKAELAGKRAICPHCHAKIDIPTESVPRVKSPETWAKAPTHAAVGEQKAPPNIADSDETSLGPTTMRIVPTAPTAKSTLAPASAAPAAPVPKTSAPQAKDPIDEDPKLRWYVMPEGGTQQYGPAPGDVMRGWLADGRVGVDSMVWREDWPDWLEAVKVFPQLAKDVALQAEIPRTVTPAVSPAPAVSAAPSVSKPEVARPAAPAAAAPVAAPTSAAPAPAAQDAPLFKVDAPVRNLAPAHAYVPANKKPKTMSLVIIILLALAMLILMPVVIYVLTRQ